MANKHPWSKFFWSDWKNDPNLCRCSKAAKGFWMDCLAMMHECEDRGVFATGGKPWSDDEIAAAVSGSDTENLSCLHELIEKGVASRNGSGAVYSRRMARESEISAIRADSGSKGGSKSRAKRKQTLSDSDSDSDSSPNGKKKTTRKHTPRAREPACTEAQAVEIYSRYPRKVGKEAALRAIVKAAERLRDDGREEPVFFLVGAVTAYAKSPAGQKPPKGVPDYRPHPASWFNAGRYDDDFEEWQRASDGKQETAVDRYIREHGGNV